MEETGLAAEASAAAAASVEASVFEVHCMASDLRHSDNTSDTPEPAAVFAVAAYHLALAASATEVLAAEHPDIPP